MSASNSAHFVIKYAIVTSQKRSSVKEAGDQLGSFAGQDSTYTIISYVEGEDVKTLDCTTEAEVENLLDELEANPQIEHVGLWVTDAAAERIDGAQRNAFLARTVLAQAESSFNT